jgi:hypothetical protein
MRRTLLALSFSTTLAVTSAKATVWEYTIDVPDDREATFQLPFRVDYPGPVTVDAAWTGPRLLFFGVDGEGPAHAALARRSGPSPQRLEISEVAAKTGGAAWILTIKALPARGEATGRLKVTVPDAPDVVAKREAELHPPPPPPPPPPSWAVPKVTPAGASPEVARIYDAVEALRVSVVSAVNATGDACGWQIEFLTYATAARDRLAGPNPPFDVPTLRYFARLVDVIHSVASIRTGTDRVIAGPIPDNRDDRRDWLIARAEIVRPIERSLDQLTELLRGGHAPALEDERWLPRFNACLTSCERFFDERVRFGSEANAPNKEQATTQWPRIDAAGRVLEAFAAYLKEPPPP